MKTWTNVIKTGGDLWQKKQESDQKLAATGCCCGGTMRKSIIAVCICFGQTCRVLVLGTQAQPQSMGSFSRAQIEVKLYEINCSRTKKCAPMSSTIENICIGERGSKKRICCKNQLPRRWGISSGLISVLIFLEKFLFTQRIYVHVLIRFTGN